MEHKQNNFARSTPRDESAELQAIEASEARKAAEDDLSRDAFFARLVAPP